MFFFVVIYSRILSLKLGLRKNVPNHFKDQRRPSSRLASVMFREKLCNSDAGVRTSYEIS